VIPEETILPAAMHKAPEPVVAPEAVETPEPSAGNSDAARSFLKTLGAGDLDLKDEELEPALSRLGHVLRTMIHGVREILMTRNSIKAEFRINQTMIATTGNNPLKFSVSPEQAVEAMVKPSTKGYLDPADAAHQALNDIKAHEVAMMTGMEAALKGVLAKLEPAELAKTIEADSSWTTMFAGKKSRYWDAFEARFDQISDQAENDFHDLFSKEFARAYQEQLERLK
jgi:type VI secretion system FHA domain protein